MEFFEVRLVAALFDCVGSQTLHFSPNGFRVGRVRWGQSFCAPQVSLLVAQHSSIQVQNQACNDEMRTVTDAFVTSEGSTLKFSFM